MAWLGLLGLVERRRAREPSGVGSAWRLLGVAVLYLLATLWMTWPLPRLAGEAVQDAGDPLFEIWVMRTVQHRLISDPAGLYQANAFYPFHNALAYSEEMIGTSLLAAPVYLVSQNDVLAYNVVFLGSFWLMAMGVYLLARELGAAPGAAFVAGLAAGFAPARFGHLSHLHMLTLGWLPLALWALTAFVRRGRARYVLAAGVALTLQLFSGLYLAVFASLTLALYLPFLLVRERRALPWPRHRVAALLVALAVPYLLLAPTLVPHLAVTREYGFAWRHADIQQLAAKPASYLVVFVTNRVWEGRLDGRTEPLFPGVVALVGAALALAFGAWRRWPAWFAGLLTLVAALLSFGFTLRVAGRALPLPYALLYDAVPPLRGLRGVGRFGLLTALGVPLLAALGYSAAWRRFHGSAGRHARLAGGALTALLALGTLVELRSDVGVWRVPNDPRATAVYAWLAKQPTGPVVEFPADGLIQPATSVNDGLFQPIRYMYYSTRYWMPNLAGYSGFIPPEHYELLRLLQAHDGLPSTVTTQNVTALQDLGVRWVIIHQAPGYDWQAATAAADRLPQLQRVADVGDSRVYALQPAAAPPLADPLGSLELATTAAADAPYAVVVQLRNPDASARVRPFGAPPRLRVEWLDASGRVARRDELTLPDVLVLPPGDSTRRLFTAAPAAPGAYTVRVRASGDILPATEQQVIVEPATILNQPALRLVSLEWDRQAALRPGTTAPVRVSWQVLRDLNDEYAVTLQLLDGAGRPRGEVALAPPDAMPSTTGLRTDDTLAVSANIPLDASLAPGAYALQVIVHAQTSGNPRLLMTLPDGNISDRAIAGGFIVGR